MIVQGVLFDAGYSSSRIRLQGMLFVPGNRLICCITLLNRDTALISLTLLNGVTALTMKTMTMTKIASLRFSCSLVLERERDREEGAPMMLQTFRRC
ncbi:hypothetical protein M8C21_010953 [Ambrosia artemisiifolia]|uniref:Uncharacterized protein n=1 Tax=Ambrosia artemisiifolia TaxID=4212 RepID=A0AAD5D8L3_AMBAR|nr:hypothetical protein M8C21_010953 [Ambrosia artemisiifolia]